MATIKYGTPGSPATILDTGLNSLANGGRALSAAFSNDGASELDLYADYELLIAAQGSARSAGAYIALYILIEVDGTNYTYGDASNDPPDTALVGLFALDASTTARYVHLRQVQLPPTDYKILLKNFTGQALAASGNTLKEERYSLASV